FGLAKLSGATGITRSHTSLGTIAYMAPEQIKGEEVGLQADIWALGIVLFELLTGKRPFRGEYTESIQYAILNEQPATITDLRPDLPSELDPIIKRMLRKDPLQRYQNVSEVLSDLEPLKTPSSGAGAPRRATERQKLRSGAKLGPYQIEKPLGSGGMGDVYLATDTRLQRQVAIKVLPPEFSEDAQLKARFQREAKTISQLSYPNICPLFDVGEQEGLDFLVMEYLEGETLADKKGPLPIPQVLKIGIQIAEALAAAHRQGIVHRDLKPGNVMITKSGTVKLVDFGLAKEVGAIATKTRGSDEKPLTDEGVIVGTLAYMAPEQIERGEADARTDIFALGAMLYEMLTGKSAFAAKTQASLISAIMHDTPSPIAAMQPLVPAAVDRLVSTCLAKDPDQRWQSVGDVKRELQWMAEGADVPTGAAPRSVWSRVLPWAVAGIFGVALVSAFLVRFWSGPWRSASTLSTRTTLSLSRDNSLTIGGGIAISPDGRTLAFAASTDEGSRLYVRRLDEWEPRAVPLTESASGPFFSPDSRWIGFLRGGSLEKVPVTGGPPQLIYKVGSGFGLLSGGRWRHDGTIIFGAFPQMGLWRVSSEGGTPQLITRPSEGRGVLYILPEPLPGDKGILFTVQQPGRTGTSIAVLAPGAEKPRILVESASHPRYLPTGHLVYVADRHLHAVPFDVQRLQVRGGAVVVVDDAVQSYDVSPTGVLVYRPAGSSTYNFGKIDRA
ncbi:MAG TPA: protein kinase, partial [Rhodothermia bacterium]|nr:protein kinase [Rhodothermia bacterium]